MSLLKRALLLGVILGMFSIVLVYMAEQFLPAASGLVILFVMLGTAIAFTWPTWFSGEPSTGALKRLARALGLVVAAAPISAVTAFLLVLMWPGYPAWADNVQRAHLVAHGTPAAEIDAAVAQHHQEPVDYLGQGAFAVAFPGVIAALATTAVGAVVLRSRPRRP